MITDKQNKQLSIGIVGLGYVGGAMQSAAGFTTFKRDSGKRVHTYDINPDREPSSPSLQHLVDNTDVIFVCVPTPITVNGSCDTRIVESVVEDIVHIARSHKIIVIKSTVPIGFTDNIQIQYPNHTIIFNPEFLTEANHKQDYLNNTIIVGVPGASFPTAGHIVVEIQLDIIGSTADTLPHFRIVDAKVAELFKYMSNTFLATKVSFANELFDMATAMDIDWNSVKSLAIEDPRLGKSHWNVPGSDGKRGFGGSCFPKDLPALIDMAKKVNVDTPVLNAVWARNTTIDRPERDWELLVGRAVSEE